MNIFSILTKEDYLSIKWQILFAVVGFLLSTAIFLGVDSLANASLTDRRIAQSEFDAARSRVNLIEEEEATIKAKLGNPSKEEISGVAKTLFYNDLNLKLLFAKKRLYYITVGDFSKIKAAEGTKPHSYESCC